MPRIPLFSSILYACLIVCGCGEPKPPSIPAIETAISTAIANQEGASRLISPDLASLQDFRLLTLDETKVIGQPVATDQPEIWTVRVLVKGTYQSTRRVTSSPQVAMQSQRPPSLTTSPVTAALPPPTKQPAAALPVSLISGVTRFERSVETYIVRDGAGWRVR